MRRLKRVCIVSGDVLAAVRHVACLACAYVRVRAGTRVWVGWRMGRCLESSKRRRISTPCIGSATLLAAGCCSRLANQQCNKQHPSAAAPANAFHANAQVIIGTHGRLKNWVAKRQLDVDRICILVFDEADEMLKADAFADDSGEG